MTTQAATAVAVQPIPADQAVRVYLDAAQVVYFGLPRGAYFDDARLIVAADTLLKSRDYDRAHRALLVPLGGRTLVLTRTADEAPGWFVVLGA